MTGKGRFISIEGVEGVGKTTNIHFIESVLREHGIDHVCTREPGGTPLSEKIRELLLDRDDISMQPITELLLMFAARAQHVAEFIKPNLEGGKWVICDRFTDSSYAYQGGGRGISGQVIATLDELILDNFHPDLTLILDLPVERGLQRASDRSAEDRFELEDVAFFNRVRDTFLELAAGNNRYRVIDASRALEDVQALVREAVEAEIRALI